MVFSDDRDLLTAPNSLTYLTRKAGGRSAAKRHRLDSSQPFDTRKDAAVKLAKETEHRELIRAFYPVIDSEVENPDLRLWLLAILACRNPAGTIETLLQPFEDARVRQGAIEILNKLTPVKGYHEKLLAAELSALRGTITQHEIEALVSDSQSD